MKTETLSNSDVTLVYEYELRYTLVYSICQEEKCKRNKLGGGMVGRRGDNTFWHEKKCKL